jgi:hypothetical protein
MEMAANQGHAFCYKEIVMEDFFTKSKIVLV